MFKLVHIQWLRAFAALAVAFLHAQHDALGLAERAGVSFSVPAHIPWTAGVDVFFVISGFIMVYTSRDLFAEPGAQRIFLARRIARIAPLYWVATTLFLLATLMTPGLLNSDAPAIWPILASYLFIPYDNPAGPIQPIFSLGWTLNYEMFFYMLFAAVLVFRQAKALTVLVTVLVVQVVIGRLHEFTQPLGFWTNPILLEFALGAALGWVRLKGVVLDRITRWCLAFGGLGYLVANLTYLGSSPDMMRPLAWGLPAACLVAAAAFEPDRPVEESWFVRSGIRLGDISYALYLVHPFVIRPIAYGMERLGVASALGLWAFMMASLVAAVSASFVVHLWFERPLTAWTRRRLEPTRAHR